MKEFTAALFILGTGVLLIFFLTKYTMGLTYQSPWDSLIPVGAGLAIGVAIGLKDGRSRQPGEE